MSNFLLEHFPAMHMVLYDTTSIHGKYRPNIVQLINRLLDEGVSAHDALLGECKDISDFVLRRTIKILIGLSQRKLVDILVQIRNGVVEGSFGGNIEGIILQLLDTPRWSKFDVKSVYDIVIYIPKWNRVIAVSSSEIESDVGIEWIPVYSNITLKNFHTYFFFNRAHGVRGRRITVGEPDLSKIDFINLIRTCSDVITITNSRRLQYFTPINTSEGLRLAFYFTLAGKVESESPVLSAGGIGYNLSQSMLRISDSSASIPLRLNIESFHQSMKYNNLQTALSDPHELIGRNVMVLGAWFLGSQEGYVVHFSLLDKQDIGNYTFLGMMNSNKKVHKSSPKWNESYLSDPECMSRISTIGEWIYYKEKDWPTTLFNLLVLNNFKQLTFSQILNNGLDRDQARFWENQILRYLTINYDTRTLYFSKDSVPEFGKVFEVPPVQDVEEPLYELREIASWHAIAKLLGEIKARGYAPEDIFDFGNGGHRLAYYWHRLRMKKNDNVDEVASALQFIYAARGKVYLPQKGV